ncbi:adenylyl-sulfate kinase [uncultured Pseudokineococcus sp.]|uniref:adenylyl-sulfate kinase n=1 Tax=uncultured Pseudokineococcus sp. TaxID=1642928 RepID=UPI00261AD081|nr:adenylyl-sulfate kinase [uncultured Pseudokineococcus sp.]
MGARRLDTPSVHLGGPATADVELVLQGLLPRSSVLGGPGAPVASGAGDLTAVRLPDRAATLAAGGVLLLDEESTPIAVLRDAAPDPARADGVTGVLEALRRPEAGLGRELSLPALVAAGADLRSRSAVVLRRPPVRADQDLVQGAGRDRPALLVVPVAGPTPDGVPADVLLRAAVAEGRRLGAPVVTVPLCWRGEGDDVLVEHVLRGLGADDGVVLRAAVDEAVEPGPGAATSAGDSRWATSLAALRRGESPSDVTGDVLSALRAWMPPRSSRGLVVLMTGLSGSGKSTLARGLHRRLLERGDRTVSLLDGDVVRRLLSSGLGFDREARDLNVRRIGYVATEVARHGGVALCAPIAPYDDTRQAVRRMVEEVADFVLVHVSTPIEECERRDLKGLYARARAGELTAFTGVSDPYEVPTDADVVVDTSRTPPDEALRLLEEELHRGGWLPRGA